MRQPQGRKPCHGPIPTWGRWRSPPEWRSDDLKKFIWPLHGGVNVGRVVQRDGDLFGTAVNVASRIAGEAKPGEVVVSRSVVDAVEPIDGVKFEAAGKTQWKNMSVPVDLFRALRSRID